MLIIRFIRNPNFGFDSDSTQVKMTCVSNEPSYSTKSQNIRLRKSELLTQNSKLIFSILIQRTKNLKTINCVVHTVGCLPQAYPIESTLPLPGSCQTFNPYSLSYCWILASHSYFSVSNSKLSIPCTLDKIVDKTSEKLLTLNFATPNY